MSVAKNIYSKKIYNADILQSDSVLINSGSSNNPKFNVGFQGYGLWSDSSSKILSTTVNNNDIINTVVPTDLTDAYVDILSTQAATATEGAIRTAGGISSGSLYINGNAVINGSLSISGSSATNTNVNNSILFNVNNHGSKIEPGGISVNYKAVESPPIIPTLTITSSTTANISGLTVIENDYLVLENTNISPGIYAVLSYNDPVLTIVPVNNIENGTIDSFATTGAITSGLVYITTIAYETTTSTGTPTITSTSEISVIGLGVVDAGDFIYIENATSSNNNGWYKVASYSDPTLIIDTVFDNDWFAYKTSFGTIEALGSDVTHRIPFSFDDSDYFLYTYIINTTSMRVVFLDTIPSYLLISGTSNLENNGLYKILSYDAINAILYIDTVINDENNTNIVFGTLGFVDGNISTINLGSLTVNSTGVWQATNSSGILKNLLLTDETNSSKANILTGPSNQLIFNGTNGGGIYTINVPDSITSSSVITFPTLVSNSSFVMTTNDQTINGIKIFNDLAINRLSHRPINYTTVGGTHAYDGERVILYSGGSTQTITLDSYTSLADGHILTICCKDNSTNVTVSDVTNKINGVDTYLINGAVTPVILNLAFYYNTWILL